MRTKTSFPGSGIGDLEANRSGRISREHALRMTWRALAGSVVGLAVGAICSSFAVRSGNGMLTLIALATASVGAYRVARLGIDIVKGLVNVREGSVRKRICNDEGGDQYFLVVGGRRLPVTKAGFSAVPEGARCRVYFLPRTGWVVNNEVLAEQPESAPLPNPGPVVRPALTELAERIPIEV